MADLRFSNQGPIVLGLGGSYPNYASIPSVFGGPTQGILISVYNRGGSYVPNTAVNNLIPTTIGTGNSVDWSDYYTSSNYNPSISPLPPVPNPAPGPGPDPKFDPGITFVQPNTPYQVYIGETYNFGKLVTKGVFTNAICTSVLISGASAINTEGLPQNISFVVQAGMNYDITKPADVVVFTNISTVNPTVNNYFTRYPLDSSLVNLPDVISATTNATVTINNLRSLQTLPFPTVTIGGVQQTVTVAEVTTLPEATLSFTVNADTPEEESDIVITNAAGDSVTLKSKFKRSVVPTPVYPPIDRGSPPNIDWQANDKIPETITVTVSNNFLAKPAAGYTAESVSSYPANIRDNGITNTDLSVLNYGLTTNQPNVPDGINVENTYQQLGGFTGSTTVSGVYGLGIGPPNYNTLTLPVTYYVSNISEVGWDSFYNFFAAWAPGGLFIFNDNSRFVLYPTRYLAQYRRATGTITFSANASQYAAWRIVGTIDSRGSNYIQLTGTVNRNAPLIEFANNSNGAFSSTGGDRGTVSSVSSTPVSGTTDVYTFSGPNLGPAGTTVYCRDSWVTAISSSTDGGTASNAVTYNGTVYGLNGTNLISISSDSPPAITALSSAGGGSFLSVLGGPQNVPGGALFPPYVIGSGGAITPLNGPYSSSSVSGNWATGIYNFFANSRAANVNFLILSSINYASEPVFLTTIFDYSTVSGRPSTSYYYNIANLSTAWGGVIDSYSTFLSFEYLGGDAWYCYFRYRSNTQLKRLLFYYDSGSRTISPPPSTQYTISRPANAKYGWSAFNITYNPSNTQTPQQVANAINTILLNNWGGTVTPTSTVTSDMNGNWIINFNTNIPDVSNTQINVTASPQTGSIMTTTSGGTVGNNLSRLSVMGAQNKVWIDSNYGYVSNGTTYLTFTHDPDSFDGNSAVIQNNFTPTSITELSST